MVEVYNKTEFKVLLQCMKTVWVENGTKNNQQMFYDLLSVLFGSKLQLTGQCFDHRCAAQMSCSPEVLCGHHPPPPH